MPEPQWLKIDVRTFDMTVLGKFGVIMADPPVRPCYSCLLVSISPSLVAHCSSEKAVKTVNWTLTACQGNSTLKKPELQWEIHQDLPYGTMSDDEMRKMNIGVLQDDGVIFLWVTGKLLLDAVAVTCTTSAFQQE